MRAWRRAIPKTPRPNTVLCCYPQSPNSRIKLGFNIYAVSVSGMRYALSGKNGKACKRTRVIPCPDTACDLLCGCEWQRMRQTESLHVAIHAAKGTKSDGGSWGIREYDVRVWSRFPFTQTRKESENAEIYKVNV